MRILTMALTLGLALLAAAPAAAQTSDSTPFHRGQWGANFTIGSGFIGAGFLHFSSPDRALLLDFAGGYSHDENTNGTGGTSYSVQPNSGSASVKLGIRRFRPLGSHVQRWVTFGLIGSYAKTTTEYPFSNTDVTESIGAGVFGNLGATWLVTQHLGIGAQWEATLGYRHDTDNSTGSPTRTDNTIGLRLDHLSLTGQVYF